MTTLIPLVRKEEASPLFSCLGKRQVFILVATDDEFNQWITDDGNENTLWLGDVPYRSIPFQSSKKAENILGQEFDRIYFDARNAFNAEVLAIATGTLRGRGQLFILFNYWNDLIEQPDADSLRWSEVLSAQKTPYFFQYFQQSVQQYHFPILRPFDLLPKASKFVTQNRKIAQLTPTREQKNILEQLVLDRHKVQIVTAKRGRGKSALAGFLLEQLSKTKNATLLTAPNKKAVHILKTFAQREPNFIAPDELSRRCLENPALFSQYWLVIDEAAMLPISILMQLILPFKKVILLTTVQGYEGTGQGFLLKLLPQLLGDYRHYQLHAPLRWAIDDPLENWIASFLLLGDVKEDVKSIAPNKVSYGVVREVSQAKLNQSPSLRQDFYQLLKLAHYRTSVSDLRRLFDAPRQHFFMQSTTMNNMAGCAWLVEEGGIHDLSLIAQIKQGRRRPKGNLVAQSLCFYSHLPIACRLKSWRLTRIAIQPKLQRQGLGKNLIHKILQQVSQQSDLDFISVSFGYSAELVAFWQSCGFKLVRLGHYREASSGCYATIALYPLTQQGKALVDKAEQHFLEDFPLSFHPLVDKISLPFNVRSTLNEDDFIRLSEFAHHFQTLESSFAALQRLACCYGFERLPLLEKMLQKQTALLSSFKRLDHPMISVQSHKQQLIQLRHEIKSYLHQIPSNAPLTIK